MYREPIALSGGDELTCPRCGTSLDGVTEETTVAVGAEQRRIRIHVHCPNPDCMAPLDLALEAAHSDMPDGVLYVEDGHRSVGQDR